MERVEVTAKATILVGGNYIEVPVTFNIKIKKGTETEMNHEVYHVLKDACIGWGADYQVKVLD